MVVKSARYESEMFEEELLDTPKGYELIDGELVEMPDMGAEASYVATRVCLRLGRYLDDNPIGVVVTAEFSYKCFPKKLRSARKPDVSVILCDPKSYIPPRIHSLVPPALMVEVLSESNTMSDITDRIKDFFSAGTKLIWVIDPINRSAVIQRPNNTIENILESGELHGEAILPGFAMKLSDILPWNPSTN